MIDQDFLADTCTGDSEERNNGVACVEAITMEMDDSSTLRWVPILLLIEPGDTLNEALVLVPICTCTPHYKTLSWKASECADTERKTEKFASPPSSLYC